MRILLISNIFPPDFLGGYELLAEQVAMHLAKRHEVHVLTAPLTRDSNTSSPPKNSAVQVERLLKLEIPFSETFRLDRLHRRRVTAQNEAITLEVINRLKPDLIFFWSQLRLTVGPMRAAMESGIVRAFTFNDENMRGFVPVPPELPWVAKGRRLLLDGIIFRHSSLSGLDFPNSLCISNFTKERLIRKGIPVHDSEILYQGIPPELFPIKKSPGELQDPVRLLFAGQILEQKGVSELIDTVRLYLPPLLDDQQVELTIAGTGPSAFEESMKQLSKDAPCKVTWLGKVPYEQLSAVYRDHDIFIFPSRNEAFGLTHLEAMASGLPLIATVSGGHGEMLEEGKTALITRTNDPKHLAERIAEMIKNPALAKQLAKNGREMVVEHFTLERYYTQIEEFLVRCAR